MIRRLRAVFSGSTPGGHITRGVARTLSWPRLRAAGYFPAKERVDFRLPNIVQATPEARCPAGDDAILS